MSAYRFCRTDDIGLLVDALNRCWRPHFPHEPPATAASFKRSIRDLQVWCSSCMVAFAGADPIGVLIGAKRASGTLVHRLAVHPDHLRQGHGRHLLESLASKLAILGPPRLAAEVPESFAAARALFGSCGYVEEAVLTDYVREKALDLGVAAHCGLVIPVTVDDLAANGLLATPHAPWERSVEALMARKDEIEGRAVASDEGLEAAVLYIKEEVILLRSFVEDEGGRLRQLLGGLDAVALRLPKVAPAELSAPLLESLGFRPASRHVVYAARAQSA